MKIRIFVLTCLMWTLLIACAPQVNVFRHEPSMAAKQADKFADIAFIKRELQTAYNMLSGGMKAHFSFEQFTELITKMHPSGYPLKVQSMEFEPMPGQKAMNIFLVGEHGEEKFYYRFTMEGVKETDYKVSGLWRGQGPYPPSKMRQPL
jgi:hypothetical protein